MGWVSREKKWHKSNETLDYLREAAERECQIRQREDKIRCRRSKGKVPWLLNRLGDQQQLQVQQPSNSSNNSSCR